MHVFTIVGLCVLTLILLILLKKLCGTRFPGFGTDAA